MDIFETVLHVKQPSQKDIEFIDCDWSDKYGLLVMLKNNQSYVIKIEDVDIPFHHATCSFLLIRWIDHHHFLVAERYNDGQKDNLYILNIEGQITTTFHCGYEFDNILPSEEGIWVSYFDKGILRKGISSEAIVLFSYEGIPLFKYHSDLLDRPTILDCYAICKGTSNSLWVLPYTDFPLLTISPILKKLDHFKVPNLLAGASALCIRGTFAYFFSPYNKSNELYAWKLNESDVHMIGKIKGVVRGLGPKESNHFLTFDDNQIIGHQILNDKEYS